MGLGGVTQYSGAAAPVQTLSSVVAQAFGSYEPWAWSFGNFSTAPCSSWLLERQIRTLLTCKGAVAYAIPVSCDGDEIGAAAVAFLVRCQTAAPPPPPSLGEKITLVWNLGPRIALRLEEFNEVVNTMHEMDAAEVGAHYMISLVGVAPHMQGRGLASQLLKAVLAAADAESMAVYLFTGNDRNEAMYAKYGFSTRSRRIIGAVGAGAHAGTEVVVRGMLRPAAARSGARGETPSRPVSSEVC